VSGDFAVMEVGSVYDGSHLNKLKVGGVRLPHFAGDMLAPLHQSGDC